jgi:hypothetical protein
LSPDSAIPREAAATTHDQGEACQNLKGKHDDEFERRWRSPPTGCPLFFGAASGDASPEVYCFYTKALTQKQFDLWYVDVFAGTGDRTNEKLTGGLLEREPVAWVTETLPASALRWSPSRSIRLTTPAGVEFLVHWFVGRLWCVCAVWRPRCVDDGVALDLLDVDRRGDRELSLDQGHSGEQGRNGGTEAFRLVRTDHIHPRHGGRERRDRTRLGTQD